MGRGYTFDADGGLLRLASEQALRSQPRQLARAEGASGDAAAASRLTSVSGTLTLW